jgi:ornithine cyclodeaminase/alanine dehydrogenase-like protein (mu-crystallin family)
LVRVLGREDVHRLAGMADVITAVREAFVAADRGRALMPAPLELRLPEADGELHVKGAYLTGAPVFAVKTATGFYRNPARGLPVSGGMTLVYDAETGRLRVLVADGGLLTELRTAAAGALAADLLARREARTAAVIGTGGQARYQLQALLQIRPIEQVRVWGRRRESAERYVRDMAAAGVTVSVAATAGEAVKGAGVVITATSASDPLVEAGWLAPARTSPQSAPTCRTSRNSTRRSSQQRTNMCPTAPRPLQSRVSCTTRSKPACSTSARCMASWGLWRRVGCPGAPVRMS